MLQPLQHNSSAYDGEDVHDIFTDFLDDDCDDDALSQSSQYLNAWQVCSNICLCFYAKTYALHFDCSGIAERVRARNNTRL